MVIHLEKNISYLRNSKGMKKTELSDLLGLGSSVTVGDYETGKTRPSFERLIKLSEIFETDLNTLVFVNLEAGEVAGSPEPVAASRVQVMEELYMLLRRMEELEGRVGDLEKNQ